jgi:hypothetical protein
VCRFWNNLTLPIYYNKIILTGAQIKFLNSNLLLGDKDQDQKFAYGKWVKALSSPMINWSLVFDNNVEAEADEDEDVDEEEEEEGMEEDAEDDEGFAGVPKFNSQEFLNLLSHLPNLKVIDIMSNAYYEFYMTLLANKGS